MSTAPANQIAAQALVQATLQNLAGQGLDSASLTVMLKAPGNVPGQSHRQHSIVASGTLDKQGTVVVTGRASNPVNQEKAALPVSAPASAPVVSAA